MYVILEDTLGNQFKEVWVLAGSELHWDGKVAYRRSGRFTDLGKPIYKKS